MQRFLVRPWWGYGAASGVLLIATFYPIYVWPLCFLALAPLYIAAGSTHLSYRQTFFAGALALGMFIFTVAFFMAVQFTWLPATEIFVNLVRTVGVAGIALVYGALFGMWLMCVRWVRTRYRVLNILGGAALWALAEGAAQWVIGGYFPGVLAYAVTPLAPLMDLSALGGVLFVSSIIALCNVLIAESFLSGAARWRDSMLTAAAFALAVGGCIAANTAYLHSGTQGPARTFSVATVQLQSEAQKTFATTTAAGTLSFPWLQSVIAANVTLKPDLFVYPGSLVPGLVAHASTTAPAALVAAQESQVATWVEENALASSTLMVWTDDVEGSTVTTGFHFFTQAGMVGRIFKQKLLRFMDYTPLWIQTLGIAANPFNVVPGQATPPTIVAGVRVGGLVCSEAVRPERARAEARSADVIVAAASEAMFQDSVIGLFTLRTLQYRAAENNTPIVRSSLQGPSALIATDGSIITSLPKGQGGVLYGTISAPAQRNQTLVNAYGNLPLWSIAVLVALLLAWAKFLGR